MWYRGEDKGTRDGKEETVMMTGTRTTGMGTRTGTGTRTRIGAGTGASTGMRIERRVKGRESPGTYEVIVEREGGDAKE